MTAPLFRVAGLRAHYVDSERQALRGTDLTVEHGDWVLLAGPNGSGKSTLLRAAAGDPRIVICGGDISFKSGTAPRGGVWPSGIAYVPQSPDEAIFATLTVLENLVLAFPRASWSGLGPRLGTILHDLEERVGEVMPSLNERLNTQAYRLSGGWRAVLALTMALIRDPAVLLIDEVTAALDAENALLFRSALREWRGRRQESNPAVVFVSHTLTEARSEATRIAFMREGRIVHEMNDAGLRTLSDEDFLRIYREKCW